MVIVITQYRESSTQSIACRPAVAPMSTVWFRSG